jgi:hypothetical protein
MTRLFATLILALAVLPVAHADLHIYSEVTTSGGDSFHVEQWISATQGTRRIGQQVYVSDLEKKTLMLIDHEARTVNQFELMDPKPLGAFEFEVEPTDRFDTIGDWSVEEFHVSNPNRPNVNYYVWATRDIKGVNTQLYYNFIRRLPSSDDFTQALQQLYGFPVRILTVIDTDDGQERIESTVILMENKAAPKGTYEAPRGYTIQ